MHWGKPGLIYKFVHKEIIKLNLARSLTLKLSMIPIDCGVPNDSK